MHRRVSTWRAGAGTPPPELAGRDGIIERAAIALDRIRVGGRSFCDSVRPTAVDDVALSGRERTFIRREVERQRCDFRRFAQASHGLTGNKRVQAPVIVSGCRQALM